MSESGDATQKPSIHQRSSLTRKGEEGSDEPVGKPTLSRRGPSSKAPTRQERILMALSRLDDQKLQLLTTRIGADELAVALLDADQQIKSRIASCLSGDNLDLFNQYLAMGKEKLPSSVIDGVQGKLLRLASA